MFERYAQEAAFAVKAATLAAKLCRTIQEEMVLPAVEKSDQSPVTVADFASQAIIARMLKERFPGAVLVAEEDSAVLQGEGAAKTLESVTAYVQRVYPEATQETTCAWIDSGVGEPEGDFWTLDPIDGTKGFLRGGQYAVALAMVRRSQVVLGALGCPTLSAELEISQETAGSVIVAVRGEGAWIQGMEEGALRRVRVSEVSDPRQARMLRSFEDAHTDPEKIEQIVRILGMERPPLLMDSSAKYGLLAGGEGEFIIRLVTPFRPEYTEKIWDHAAGSLIVEEAGGQVTDLRGKPLDFGQGRFLEANVGVLASNGRLHDRVLEAVAEVGADRRPETS